MALTSMVLWFGVVIIVIVTITKFMFICVWKSMRTMNDDLMVRIALNQALLFWILTGSLQLGTLVSCVFQTIAIQFLKGEIQKSTFLLQPVCTGTDVLYDNVYHQSTILTLVQRLQLLITVCGFFITFGLSVAVFIGKRKMMTNNHLIKPPKSLESQVINITVIGLVIFSILCNRLYWGK